MIRMAGYLRKHRQRPLLERERTCMLAEVGVERGQVAEA